MKQFRNIGTGILPRRSSHRIVGAVLLSLSATGAVAEPAVIHHLPRHLPQICTGFNRASQVWGDPADRVLQECGEHEAMLAVRLAPPHLGSRFKQRVWGNCCPLPAADILDGKHQWVDELCPDGTAVTGLCESKDPNECKPGKLRCTGINQQRYMLALDEIGTFWGFSSRSAFPWREKTRIKKTDIPLGIRNGVTKINRYMSAVWGCVGTPPGSLFSGTAGMRCITTQFRILRYRGLRGDPAEGTPVTMFPDCRRLSDTLEPEMKCEEP